MSKESFLIIFIGAILGFIIILMVGLYTRLLNRKSKVIEKFEQIDLALQKKCEIIPNLIDILKEYFQDESLFEEIINARNILLEASDINSKINANLNLDNVLIRIFDVCKNNINLNENKKYQEMVKDFEEYNNKIDYAISFYNDSVADYNNFKKKFPLNIFIKLMKSSNFNFYNK